MIKINHPVDEHYYNPIIDLIPQPPHINAVNNINIYKNIHINILNIWGENNLLN